MDGLSSYGILALAVLALTFYFVRQIRAYVIACGVLVCGFAALTLRYAREGALGEWVVAVLGLGLCSFGLLIVRVMLIRSVSLLLLGEIAAGRPGRMDERLGGRPSDMRAFRLISERAGANHLTGFGRFIGGVVATLYTLFRVAR